LAVITGASSGIGQEFSRALAQQGYDLLLVARREARLLQLSDALRLAHGVQSAPFAADLSTDAGIGIVEERIRTLDGVALLVNCAGFGQGKPLAQAALPVELDRIRVHVEAPTRLCHAVLPAMLTAGCGGIVNVASIAAFASLPGNTGYCATKSYLVRFSQALAAEVRSQGVRVQALCPGFVVSEFHDTLPPDEDPRKSIPSFVWSRADDVVDSSLRALARGRVVVVPGWHWRVVYGIARLGLLDWLARSFTR
jgi:short-subunit dehydrogenase